MATPNVRDILSVPGRLSVGPTGLTSAYPHGGTAFGIVHETVLSIEHPYKWVTAEEYGGQRVDGVITGEGCSIGFILRSWDKDVLQRVFPNTSVGASSGRRLVASPGAVRPGELMSNRSVVLLFTPDDADRHPMFLMRRALPAIKETAEVMLRVDQEFGLPVIFHGIRDASGKLYEWGMAHDIAL